MFELKEITNSLKTWRFWRTIIAIIIGSFIFSISINGIIIPHKFYSGGVSGISLVIYYLVGWPSVGVIYFLINIPIFILGGRQISVYFVFISMIGVFILTFALETTSGMVIPMKENMLAAVFAGVLTGVGTGMYLRVGGSAGGVDIIATVIKKKLAIPMGTTFIIVDAIPITTAAVLFNLETALYTAICMYVHSVVVEKVQTGFSQRKAVFVISNFPDLIAEKVMKQLDRGVTFFHSSGGFSKDERRVIYTVIHMKELGRLKKLLFDTDPDAFVAISNTAEVIGRRFLSWEDEGFSSRTK